MTLASAANASEILLWNGSAFEANPAGGCALSPSGTTTIGVGPNQFGNSNGTPWVIGCTKGSGGNYGVYELNTTKGGWQEVQGDAATQIAVGPSGVAWVVNAAGNVYYWNGSHFTAGGPAGICASYISVAAQYGSTTTDPVDDVWITGCGTAGANQNVYNLTGWTGGTSGTWSNIESNVATQVSAASYSVSGVYYGPQVWALNNQSSNNVLYESVGSPVFEVWPNTYCATSISGVGVTFPGWLTGCAESSNEYGAYEGLSTGWTLEQNYVARQVVVSTFGPVWAVN